MSRGDYDHPVRSLRRARGWTQEDLAKRAGVAIRTVSNIERYAYEPTHPTRKKILAALGIEWQSHREIFFVGD